MAETDRVLRAMTDDGSFRIVAARTTSLSQAIVSAQEAQRDDARQLSELVTGAVLYRETMAPSLRVQCIIKGGDDTGFLTADSHPEGWSRGLLQLREGASAIRIDGGDAVLQMQRHLPDGQLHRGVVSMPEGGDISRGLMGYMEGSEQVLSMVAVGAHLEEGKLDAAGGYLVQLLPEAREHESTLAILTERLVDFEDIAAILARTDASPRRLIEEIFHGMDFTWLHDSEVRFGCDCSRERIMGSLASLGREDVEALLADEEPLDMSCNYCGARYMVEEAALRGLLSPE